MNNLHSACVGMNLERVRQLIDEGADVNAIFMGSTPLLVSSVLTAFNFRGDLDVAETERPERQLIKLLLESGADPNQKMQYDGATVLNLAISSRDAARSISIRGLTNAPNVIIEHVVELEARTNKRLLDDHNKALINENPELKEHCKKCQAELMAMWCNGMIEGTSITYFSILMEPVEVVARYARNKEFVKEFESGYYQTAYPVYASRLREKFDAAVARQKRIEQVCTTYIK